MTGETGWKPIPRRRRWLSSIGVIILIWLFWGLGPNRILEVISSTDVWLFAMATLLYFPTILLRIWRWQILIRCIGVHCKFWRASQGYLIAILIGLGTPGRVGEFSRAVFLKNDCGVPVTRGLPIVLADRLFDFLVVLPFGILALISFGPVAAGSTWVAVIGLIVVMSVGIGIILHGPTITRLSLIIKENFPRSGVSAKISEFLLEMNWGFRQIKPGIFILALVATIAAFGLFFLECFLISESLEMQVTPLATTYAISLGTLIAMIPISISGVGTRDAAIIAYLGLHTVPSPVAISFSLLWFVAFYGMSGIFGTVAWWLRSLAADLR